MKLIQLLYYIEKFVPIKIKTKDNGFILQCYSNEVETILKEKEKETPIYKNLNRIVLEQEIEKIDYDGEMEELEIILKI